MSATVRDAQLARDAKRLVRSTTAKLAGQGDRGTDRRVRRNSYDVDDRRAKVFTRIADGTRAGGLGFIDDIVKLAEEYDLTHRKRGERGPLMASGVRVLKIMLEKFLDFRTGQLDPAVKGIATVTGYTYKTVHAALKRLAAHGFLDWVRRSQRTANAGGAGPQREQVSNAYHFTFAEMPKAVLQRWRDLRERRRRRQAAQQGTAPTPARPAAPSNPALAKALADLAQRVASANPERGEYPHAGIKG
jgi:hypothetical protein